jgi:fused signal recognition particle receptor
MGLGSRLKQLFSGTAGTDQFYEDLEDLLIEADLGSRLTMEYSERLQKGPRVSSREELVQRLQSFLREDLRTTDLDLNREGLNVLLFLGVNGVGKTTNLAKVAHWYRTHWETDNIVLAAGDTFRAAAVEQLSLHADRLKLRIVKQSSGSDAGAVIYDAITSAVSRGDSLVLADTAGRMHNRANLVRELEKIHGIIHRQAGDSVTYRKILVIDGTTGQNALQQAEMFHTAVGVDAVILAKYDSSARGGILVPLARNFQLPCAWLGTGEGYEHLIPFEPERYVNELLAP